MKHSINPVNTQNSHKIISSFTTLVFILVQMFMTPGVSFAGKITIRPIEVKPGQESPEAISPDRVTPYQRSAEVPSGSLAPKDQVLNRTTETTTATGTGTKTMIQSPAGNNIVKKSIPATTNFVKKSIANVPTNTASSSSTISSYPGTSAYRDFMVGQSFPDYQARNDHYGKVVTTPRTLTLSQPAEDGETVTVLDLDHGTLRIQKAAESTTLTVNDHQAFLDALDQLAANTAMVAQYGGQDGAAQTGAEIAEQVRGIEAESKKVSEWISTITTVNNTNLIPTTRETDVAGNMVVKFAVSNKTTDVKTYKQNTGVLLSHNQVTKEGNTVTLTKNMLTGEITGTVEMVTKPKPEMVMAVKTVTAPKPYHTGQYTGITSIRNEVPSDTPDNSLSKDTDFQMDTKTSAIIGSAAEIGTRPLIVTPSVVAENAIQKQPISEPVVRSVSAGLETRKTEGTLVHDDQGRVVSSGTISGDDVLQIDWNTGVATRKVKNTEGWSITTWDKIKSQPESLDVDPERVRLNITIDGQEFFGVIRDTVRTDSQGNRIDVNHYRSNLLFSSNHYSGGEIVKSTFYVLGIFTNVVTNLEYDPKENHVRASISGLEDQLSQIAHDIHADRPEVRHVVVEGIYESLSDAGPGYSIVAKAYSDFEEKNLVDRYDYFYTTDGHLVSRSKQPTTETFQIKTYGNGYFDIALHDNRTEKLIKATRSYTDSEGKVIRTIDITQGFLDISRDGNKAYITIQGSADVKAYNIYYKDNIAGDWILAASEVAAQSGKAVWVDSSVASKNQEPVGSRFYKAEISTKSKAKK
ncbi:MAG: hypothetical protein EXS63_05505 [Candidatus Omnitrophica bacterium]|nr:hypothetical protein [Candidatus Omnitrophota bacterium]